MYEARKSSRGVADRNNCSNMEEEGKCARPREIPKDHTSKSNNKAAREDPEWGDPKENRAIIG